MSQAVSYIPFESDTKFHTFVLSKILKRPLIVILVIGIVTLSFGWHIQNLTFRTSVYDMVVEDLPETVRYVTFKEVFGSDEIIRVVIKTDDVFASNNFDYIETLSAAAEKLDGIRRVVSLAAMKNAVEVSGPWSLEKLKEKISSLSLIQKNLLSEDQRTTVLTLVLAKNADKQGVIGAIQALIDDAPPDISVYQIGMPLVSQAMARYTEYDFLHLPPITLLLVAIILWLLYRNWVGVIAPLGAVVAALAWTLGLMGWMGVPLSMMTMIVPVFLIAVGTAYCMHIMSTYLNAAQYTDSRRKAVLHCYSRMSLPTVLAVATTVIGLSSLLVNRIKSIHEFSLFASFAIISLLVILFSAFPAILLLLPHPKSPKITKDRPDLLNRCLEFIINLNLKHRKPSLICLGVVALFCLVGTFFLVVETNPVGFFKADTPIRQHFHDIYQDLSGSFPVNVVMEADDSYYFETPENIARIEQAQQYLETLPGIDKSVSFADYVKLVNYALNTYDLKAYRVPEEGFEVRMAINNYKSMLGEDVFARHMTSDLSKTNILLFTHLSSSSDFLEIRDEILAHVRSHFPDTLNWDVTGFGMAVASSSHLLTRGQIKSFSLTMILIFVIMLMLFLSIKVGFIAILSNAFPILITFGVMGWAGIPLSVVTSLIASIAIGLAVDDTIHYLYRYNHEFKKDLNKDRSLRDTILHVGRPIFFTTLTIGIGFSVLLFPISSRRPFLAC